MGVWHRCKGCVIPIGVLYTWRKGVMAVGYSCPAMIPVFAMHVQHMTAAKGLVQYE